MPLEGTSHTGPHGAGVARPARTPDSHRIAIAGIVLAAGAVAATASAAPTANGTADIVWLALLGATVAAAGWWAHRWSLLILAAAAGVVTTGWPQLAAAVAVIALVATVAANREWPLVNAGAAALAVNALVRASDPIGSDVITLALGTIGVLLVLGSALTRMPRRPRLISLAAAGLLMLVCAATAVATLVAVLGTRSDAEAGVSAARAGLAQAADADTEAATANFNRAEALLRSSHDRLTRPWVRAGLALPIVGQNLHATTELTAAGTRVASSALSVADVADPSRLVISGSHIDVDVLAAARPELRTARAALDDARAVAEQVDSPWLLGPLTDRIDTLNTSIDDAIPTIDTLMAVADLLPPMLGTDAPRTYLVLFTTPAETRGIGGFVGSWAVLNVDRGELTLGDRGRASELNIADPDGEPYDLDAPQEYLDRYYRYYVERFPVNVTASPDFPTVGQVAAHLWPQTGTPPIDGVILADPSALAALLEITGPIQVPDLDDPLTADTLEDFLWLDQYVLFPVVDRVDVLDTLIDAMFDRLTTTTIDPRQVRDTLAPMVDGRRIMVWSAHPEEAELLGELGLDGAFPRIEAGEDLLSVRTANANANKIDTFLQRSIDYTATVEPDTGDLDATVTVTLTNHAVDDPALPDYVLGTIDPELDRAWNQQWVSLYSPHQLESLTVDGAPVDAEVIPELGVATYALYVDIPPGSSVEITFELTGSVDPDHYRLHWAGQPTVRPDQLSFDISTGAGSITVSTTTSENLELTPTE